MELLIREVEPRDVDAVMALMHGLAAHEGLSQYLVLDANSFRLAVFGEPQRFGAIVAEMEGRVVGYVTYMERFAPWAGREFLYLDDLYVVESARRKGAGRGLMEAVGSIAHKQAMQVRWQVEVGNTAAQAFYRALGADLQERILAYWQP